MKITRIALLSLAAMLIMASCKKDDDNPTPDPNPSPSTKELKLSFTGLENLGMDYAYEGWIMVDGAPVTTGTFMVDDNGNLSKSSFMIDATQLDKATAFILTIEPYPDNDPAPSDVHVLAGDFSSSSADLKVDHMAALGNDFMNAMGYYILATPTSSTMDDELSGVWFLDLSSGSPATGLQLPELPAGWVYEGWAVTDGVPVSTGRFSRGDMADYAAPYSATDAGSPPFPGEDFLMNAPAGLSFPTQLNGGLAVISIEPEPDNSPNPFALKPLVGEIPMSAMDHKTYMLDNNSGSFPTGMATR
jgi:hypothetical protein